MSDIHQDVLEEISRTMQAMQKEFGLELPPKAFVHMDGKFVSYVRKKELVCTFYADPEFSNPMHVMQGGFLGAAIDNTMGPLSYLATGKATTTLELSVNYIRMVKEAQRIQVAARVVARGNQHLYMEAEAVDEDGKQLARASSQVLILRMPSSRG